jgi:hypothetical protein
MTELSQFSNSSVVLPGADRRALLAMQPFTLLEIVQEDVGTIGWGYVLNPRRQITVNDDHTLTLDLTPITWETMRRRTGRNWTAATLLSVIGARLMGTVPGWTATFTDAGRFTPDGKPYDVLASVTLPNPTIQAAFLGVAKQFAQFARMGVGYGGAPVNSITGGPVRTLEMGQFGAAATVHLVSANGADPERAGANDLIQLVATIDQTPANVENLVNVCIPFGGNSSNTIVNLERLWRIINDPQYINYGRFGPDADSIARTGLPSLFTQYDPAYPISDPLNPPTGAYQWTFLDTAGNALPGPYGVLIGARGADGTVPLFAFDATGVYQPNVVVELAQGNAGTRRFTLGGDGDYVVYDAASYATYGYSEGELIDSGLTYADNSPANQELTEIALYVEAVTNFKRFGHPHQTFACTVENATGRPTRAGDLISVDVERMSEDDTGAVVELAVAEDLKVMSVIRTFSQTAPPSDAYTLSNLGRFDENDSFGAASTQQAMVALQLQQGTGLAKDSVIFAGNIDAANPITIWHYIAAEHFRYHQVRVRCDWFPFRGTATTAQNQAGTYVVSADVEVSLATPADINALAANIGGVPGHTHQVPIDGTSSEGAPTGSDAWLKAAKIGDIIHLIANNNVFGFMRTNGPIENPVLDPTSHPHVVAKAKDIIAHITPGQRIANLPLHVHDVEKRIPTGQPSPASITMSIDGQALSSGVLATGTRDTSGAFTSAFIVDNIGPQLDTFPPNTDVPLRFDAGTNAVNNPFGVGYLQITITAVEELGGITSTTRAN